MAMTDALLAEYDHEMTVTRKLLERVPDDRFDWRPHPKSMTLGALAQHLATIPFWGLVTLTEKELDLGAGPAPEPLTTRAAVLEKFDGVTAQTRAALTGRSDADLLVPWALKKDGHQIFSMPRAQVWRTFVISHLIHHRGQMSLYLRLNDLPVPSIYGPSADEIP